VAKNSAKLVPSAGVRAIAWKMIVIKKICAAGSSSAQI
jgi:hypothetical protein